MVSRWMPWFPYMYRRSTCHSKKYFSGIFYLCDGAGKTDRLGLNQTTLYFGSIHKVDKSGFKVVVPRSNAHFSIIALSVFVKTGI